MTTEITKIFSNNPDFDLLSESVKRLADSEPFIFPTETVYGIGCRLSDIQSIERIFELKHRDFSKPMAAHVSSINQVYELCEEIPNDFEKLLGVFFPGPLSIVMKKKKNIPDLITAGFNSIAIRYPDDIIFNSICETLGEPIIATSANISGNKSQIDTFGIISEFNGKVRLIIDSGITKYKGDSSVLSLTQKEPILLREGVVSLKQIENVLNKPVKRIS
jgi:L-threonylcarbamoyladenylate synthase